MRGYVLVGVTSLLASSACGGGDKKKVEKPKVKDDVVEKKKPETEEDRAEKRRAQALKIVPEGSTCLPVALKEDDAPRLELAAVGQDAIVCAIDTDTERLLGPVGCWKVDLASGGLTYKDPEPLPARGFSVRMHEDCAWGYCLPKEAKGAGDVAHIAWGLEGKKVAVLVGDEVHLFDAESKEHDSSFSIRGDKAVDGKPVAVHLMGESVIVEAEGEDEGPFRGVWVFKADGTPMGPVNVLGGKKEAPVSIYKGSLSFLDKERIALSEKGMSTMTTFKVDDGARAKLVRKVAKASCKPAEMDAYWVDGDNVSDKCKASMDKLNGHLIGATAVAGAKNFLVLLRGSRLGELGVLDAKTLAEKKVIKMPWCTGDGGGEKDDDDKADEEAEEEGRAGTRGPKRTADPEEGGE